MKADKQEPLLEAVDFGEGKESFHLKLYVAGQTPKSLAAIGNLRKICEIHLKDRYQIEIIDLIEDPSLARTNQILAIPTLIRSLPAPVSRIIGDLSDENQVLMGLNITRVG